MDLNTLQAFIEVADRRSFSAAAENLYLTQPAISKRVAQLEENLGTRVFDRIGRRTTLTEVGRALLPRARRLLNDANDLKRVVADLSGEVTGALIMGTSHHIGLHRLPKPLKQFTRKYPAVELDIRFMDSEDACRAVEVGDIEMAIVTLPPQPIKNLDMQQIWEDPLVFVAARDHELAGIRDLTLDQLMDYAAVLPSSGTYTRGILEKAIREKGLELQLGMSTNYLETLSMLVGSGLGWSLLPERLMDEQVQALPINELQLSRKLGVVTHQQRSLSHAGRKMIALCSEEAPG